MTPIHNMGVGVLSNISNIDILAIPPSAATALQKNSSNNVKAKFSVRSLMRTVELFSATISLTSKQSNKGKLWQSAWSE